MRCERVDVWRDCDEVRVLDEGMDEVNVRRDCDASGCECEGARGL